MVFLRMAENQHKMPIVKRLCIRADAELFRFAASQTEAAVLYFVYQCTLTGTSSLSNTRDIALFLSSV